MKEHNMCLTVLGARGSLPVSDTKRSRFGGATSCYMVQAGSETIFLDGGTGLVSAPALSGKPPVILLSHLHLDHVIGLGMYLSIRISRQPLSVSKATEATLSVVSKASMVIGFSPVLHIHPRGAGAAPCVRPRRCPRSRCPAAPGAGRRLPGPPTP